MTQLLLIVGIILYAIAVKRILSWGEEAAWDRRKNYYNRQGIVAQKPENWSRIHRTNQIMGVLAPPVALLLMLTVYLLVK